MMKKTLLGMTTAAFLGFGATTLEAAPTKVTVWHAMGGVNQQGLDETVARYNASQDEVEVEAIYQGSYDETLNKFRAVAGTDESPSVVQVFEIGTQFMANSGYVTPIQDFMDKENYDESQLEEFILNYYKINGDLYSMPFNSSSAIMFYNKDAFKNAGLDPENAPQSFEDLKTASEKLANGDDTRFGFAMLMNGWFFEQLLANSGGYFTDNSNGRDARPEKVAFNTEEGREIFQMLRDMYQNGSAESFGRNWDDLDNAFISQQTGMYLNSSAGLRGVIDNSEFEVGAAYLPGPTNEFSGALIGGASMWISNSVEDEKQDAAWDFLKYAASAKEQAIWANATGYYPINTGAYDEQVLIDNNEKYPQFQQAIAQIQNSENTKVTQGALLGVFPEVRERVVIALEENYAGTKSVDRILTDLERDANRIIARYNMLNN